MSCIQVIAFVSYHLYQFVHYKLSIKSKRIIFFDREAMSAQYTKKDDPQKLVDIRCISADARFARE